MSTSIVDMALHENVPSITIVDMAVNVLKAKIKNRWKYNKITSDSGHIRIKLIHSTFFLKKFVIFDFKNCFHSKFVL